MTDILARDLGRTPDDPFTRTWGNRVYTHVTLVRHTGKVLAIAQDDTGQIVYSVLNPSRGTSDADGWSELPGVLSFPSELTLVGFGATDPIRLPRFRRSGQLLGSDSAVDPLDLDPVLSTTARLSALAPVQVLSDGDLLYVFRQAANLSGTQDANQSRLPLEDGTLLLDRFVLVDDELQNVREVRFQRSRSKTRPANAKDGLGSSDLEGRAFVEPTQVLRFVADLVDGDVSVLLTPTTVSGVQRWQFIRRDHARGRLDFVGVARTREGLFDTRGTQPLVCPDHPSSFALTPGTCPAPSVADPTAACRKDLVARAEQNTVPGSALRLGGGDRVRLENAHENATTTGPFTLEVWVCPEPATEDRLLLGSGVAEATAGPSVWLAADGGVRSGFGDGIAWHEVVTSPLLADGIWQHLAVVVDGSVKVFLDGRLRARQDLTGALSPLDGPLVQLGGGPAGVGVIDDVRFWETSRSGRDIAAAASVRLTGFEPGLRHYWRLDEGDGNVTADLAGSLTGALKKSLWCDSGAKMTVPPGLTRSSIALAGLALSTGPAAVVYHQQESAPGGYLGEDKPLKTRPRVMVALGVTEQSATDPAASGGRLAVLDLGIHADGSLADVPSALRLDTDAISASGRTTAQQLTKQLATAADTLDAAQRAVRDSQAASDALTQQIAWAQRSVDQLRTGEQARLARGEAPGENWRAYDYQKQLLEEQLRTSDGICASNTLLLREQSALIATLRGQLSGEVGVYLPLVAVDSVGATICGVSSDFLAGSDRPSLSEGALGRVTLYCRGASGELLAAQFETRTERPTVQVPCGDGFLVVAARTPELVVAPAATITVTSDGGGTVVIALSSAGVAITETWKGMPRRAADVAAVLNGSVRPEGTIYDFTRAVSDPPADLRGGSRLVTVVPHPAAGDLEAGAFSLPSTESGRGRRRVGFRSRRPGWSADLSTGGWLTAPTDDLSRADDLTLEAWVEPMTSSGAAVLVSQRSGGERYCLGLSPDPSVVSASLGSLSSLTVDTPMAGVAFSVEAWVWANHEDKPFYVGLSKDTKQWGFARFKGKYGFGVTTLSGDFSGYRIESLTASAPAPATDARSWVHLAGTYDGTVARLYRNGDLVSAEPVAAPAFVTSQGYNQQASNLGLVTTPQAWTLGGATRDLRDVAGGRLDEVRFWSRAVTGAEIVSLLKQRLPTDTPDLQEVVRFSAAGGSQAAASAGSASFISAAEPALPAFRVVGAVGETALESVDVFSGRVWRHAALTYQQRHAVQLQGPGGWIDAGRSAALAFQRDLTIELVVALDDLTAPHSLVGRGDLSGASDGAPYQLSVDTGGHLVFAYLDGAKQLRCATSTVAMTTGCTRVAASRQIVTPAPVAPDAGALATGSGVSAGMAKVTAPPPFVRIQFKIDDVDAGTVDLAGPTDVAPSSGVTGIGRGWATALTRDALGLGPAKALTAIAAPGMRGILAEMRLWGSAVPTASMNRPVSGSEPGLTTWWQFPEGLGARSTDTRGSQDLRLHGDLTWVATPARTGSPLSLLVDGRPVPTRVSTALPTTAVDQFTIGAELARDGTAHQPACARLAELRVWRVVRSVEQIQDNMFRRIGTALPELMAAWTFEPDEHAALPDQRAFGPALTPYEGHTVLSTAPISDEGPQVQDALLPTAHRWNVTVDDTPTSAEYADLQMAPSGGASGVFKRCYGYIADRKLCLVTGFKVGDMATEWLGQVQTDPQLIGYIEGAPPVPGENLTQQADYSGASMVTLTSADSTAYTYASSQNTSRFAKVDQKAQVGLEVETQAGFIVENRVAKIELHVGDQYSWEEHHGWVSELSTGRGSALTAVSELALTRDPDTSKNNFVPANRGYALVRSETADVFALRLLPSNTLISYSMRANPDIPRDWNVISFEIDKHYTKQGVLDGRSGNHPDDDFPNAATYGSDLSYFKPVEAYALKNRIVADEQRLRTMYTQASGEGPAPDLSAVRRNLVNTYVWTADGGRYAEEEQTLDSRHETQGGTYNWSSAAGLAFDFSLFTPAGVKGELSALFGSTRDTTTTKSVDSSSSFGVSVSVAGERDLSGPGAVVGRAAGKVDAYRFMTFYLDPDPENFDTFYHRVVDPDWLASNDPGAAALREAQQFGKRPPCWRVMHRVTYVSRVRDTLGGTGTALEKAMQTLDLNSNYELVRTVDPLIRPHRNSYSEFTTAVRVALATHLPNLVPHTKAITDWLLLYYEVAEVPGLTGDGFTSGDGQLPSVTAWVEGDPRAGEAVAVGGLALDEQDEMSPFVTHWSFVSGPTMVVITEESNPSTTVIFPEAGAYRLRLSAIRSHDIDLGASPGYADVVVAVTR